MSNCSTKAFNIPLKGCPVCGKYPIIVSDMVLREPRVYRAMCPDCIDVSTPFLPYRDMVKKWNSIHVRG